MTRGVTMGTTRSSGVQVVLLALIAAWLLALLVTHTGSRSPYTYQTFALSEPGPTNRLVHPDAMTVLPVTRFFYDATPTRWDLAHNLHLPFHSFSAAVAISFIRDYRLANYALNLLFLLLVAAAAIRLGLRSGVPPAALLVGLMTVFALPAIVPYLGQPMHYVTGTAINWLMMLTAIALPQDELRRPVVAGAIVAILALNYDWYVYAAALVIVLAFVGFRRRRDDALFVLVAVAPPVIWHALVQWITSGASSTNVRELFIESVIVEWAAFFQAPVEHALFPFITSHVGVHIGLHHIIALIYWPLVACTIAGLWRSRPPGSRATQLCVALLGFFILEQIASAAFDWENNPRRALPVVFAFGCCWCWLIWRNWSSRPWRLVTFSLLLMTALLAFADTLTSTAGATYLHTPDGIRTPAKDALRYEARTVPARRGVDSGQTALLASFGAARVSRPAVFIVTQLFVAVWLVTFFWLLARADLLPRAAPLIAAAAWLLSAVRFV